jgi:hypothetical protein
MTSSAASAAPVEMPAFTGPQSLRQNLSRALVHQAVIDPQPFSSKCLCYRAAEPASAGTNPPSYNHHRRHRLLLRPVRHLSRWRARGRADAAVSSEPRVASSRRELGLHRDVHRSECSGPLGRPRWPRNGIPGESRHLFGVNPCRRVQRERGDADCGALPGRNRHRCGVGANRYVPERASSNARARTIHGLGVYARLHRGSGRGTARATPGADVSARHRRLAVCRRVARCGDRLDGTTATAGVAPMAHSRWHPTLPNFLETRERWVHFKRFQVAAAASLGYCTIHHTPHDVQCVRPTQQPSLRPHHAVLDHRPASRDHGVGDRSHGPAKLLLRFR